MFEIEKLRDLIIEFDSFVNNSMLNMNSNNYMFCENLKKIVDSLCDRR